MNIKGAIVIIRNINNSLISDSDKIEAIKVVSENKEDPTIAITGHEFYDVALNWLIEKIEQKENSDIHNNSTDDAGKCERKENTDMSAFEFLKVFKKICSEECTDKCPFDDEKEGCSFYKDDIHVIIRKVEAWIKAHSIANLTERQKAAIKGRIAEGYLWVSRDESKQTGNCVYFFDKKPFPSNHGFDTNGGFVSSCETSIYDFVTFENSPIYLPDLLKENN